MQPNGSILLVLQRSNAHRDDIIPDYKSEALCVLWRMCSMQISRRDMIYLLPDLDCSVSWADVAPWLTRLSEPASRLVTILEGSAEMPGAYCSFPEQLELMYQARAVAAPHAMQTGGSRYTLLTIGVHGTNRWNRGYVHCAVAGWWSGPNDLANWWLFEGSDQWPTVCRMQTECNVDSQLRAAQALRLPHADGVERQPLLFLRADGKAHLILVGGECFTKKSLGGMVRHCCGKNREAVLHRFGAAEVAMAGIEGRSRLTGVFHDIPLGRRIPDYGAHGVLRVSHCALTGMVRVLREHGGMLRGSAANLVQDSVNRAQKNARTARLGRWGCEKTYNKGLIGIELRAAVHFVRVRLWLPLLQKVGTIIGGHQVGGRPGVDVCRDWWHAVTAMANVAWKDEFVSGHEQLALLQQQLTMGARHLALGWRKTLWTHMWIDHMFACLCRWGTLAKFNYFALEGSHVQLKRLIRNSGGD